MPQVRRYGAREIAATPIAGVKRQVTRSAESFGSGFGETVRQIATSVGGDYLQQLRDKADQVALLEADNKVGRWEAEAIYHPTTGALQKKGKDAFALPEEVDEQFAKATEQITAGLANDRQRARFAAIVANRQDRVRQTIFRHVSSEMDGFYDAQAKAGIVLAQSSAVASMAAGDTRGAAEDLAKGKAIIADHLKGQSPERLAEATLAFTTATHTSIIDQLITGNRDKDAKAYFEETQGQINGTSWPEITRKLDTASTEGEGLRASVALWEQYGPKTDLDPIQLDVMEEAARKQFQDDTKGFEATRRFLRERKSAVDASRQDRVSATTGTLWKAASDGATLSQLRQMPEYLAVDGKVQAQLADYVVSKAEHAASLAYTQEQRAYTREQRAYARETRAENEKERRGWAMMWQYGRPEILSQMSDNQVLALTGDLGTDHVNRLMAQKRELSTPAAVRAATIDADLFNQVAQGAGFHPYASTLPEEDRSMLGRLRMEVESSIDAEQRARGNKELGRAEKMALMQSIVDRRVMLNATWSDPERVAAVVGPEDQASAYVPLTRVPDRSVEAYANYLRSTLPAAQGLSTAQIRTRYQNRLQRAYAAQLMRLGDAEVIKRLGEP